VDGSSSSGGMEEVVNRIDSETGQSAQSRWIKDLTLAANKWRMGIGARPIKERQV